jgi:hypothetical protein
MPDQKATNTTAMQATLAFACFVAGAAAFLWFFSLVPRLRRERLGTPTNKLESWFPWLPGHFTPAGTRLRRQMNRLIVFGWIFLIAGLLISPR